MLRGTKQVAAAEREVRSTRGRSDGRTLVIVPEVKGAQTVGLTLLHVRAQATGSPADVAHAVLAGYRNRYAALRGAVTETEPTFDDQRLWPRSPLVDLLTRARSTSLADRWRAERPTARRPGVLGIGTDLVEIDRFRLALDRRARIAERLFSDAEREYAFASPRTRCRTLAARFAREGSGDEGARASGCGSSRCATSRSCGSRAASPRSRCTGKAAELADERGVDRWHLTLTHTDTWRWRSRSLSGAPE